MKTKLILIGLMLTLLLVAGCTTDNRSYEEKRTEYVAELEQEITNPNGTIVLKNSLDMIKGLPSKINGIPLEECEWNFYDTPDRFHCILSKYEQGGMKHYVSFEAWNKEFNLYKLNGGMCDKLSGCDFLMWNINNGAFDVPPVNLTWEGDSDWVYAKLLFKREQILLKSEFKAREIDSEHCQMYGKNTEEDIFDFEISKSYDHYAKKFFDVKDNTIGHCDYWAKELEGVSTKNITTYLYLGERQHMSHLIARGLGDIRGACSYEMVSFNFLGDYPNFIDYDTLTQVMGEIKHEENKNYFDMQVKFTMECGE